MGNYTIFKMFENPRRGRQARNFTTNAPKILDLKSSSEQIFSENSGWVPLTTIWVASHADVLGGSSRIPARLHGRLLWENLVTWYKFWGKGDS